MKYQSPIVFVSTFTAGFFADFVTKRYAEAAFVREPVNVF